MPSGRTHEAINMAVFSGMGLGYAWARAHHISAQVNQVLTPSMLTVFSFSFLIGSFLVTPDLDLANQHVSAKSHWGSFGFLWFIYGKIFRHRGLSHSWFIGPLSRIIYMIVISLAVFTVISYLLSFFGYDLQLKAHLLNNWRQLLLGALLGYYISQWSHLVADGIWPDHGYGRSRKK